MERHSHEAYESVPIVEWKTLPFQIEAIDTYGSQLLIATSKGHVLVYEVPKGAGGAGSGRFKAELKMTKKDFLKKEKKAPIDQMTAIEEFNLLLVLAEGYVHVLDLAKIELKDRIELTKGCTLYAVDVQLRSDASADSHRTSPIRKRHMSELTLRLATIVKKKLITFEWFQGTFQKSQEYALPDNPKAMLWCGRNVCVGFKKEYDFIDERGGSVIKIFDTGGNQEPLTTRLPGNEILLQKDSFGNSCSIFLGINGKPTRSYGVAWSEMPLVIDMVNPYLVGLLPRYVEVRAVEEQSQVVQQLDMPKARFMCQNDEAVYIASPTTCWRLEPVPLDRQIEQLLLKDKYEDALKLADLIQEATEAKAQRIFVIKRAFAFSEFAKKHFDVALKTFAELDIDPPHVIGLYPTMLPEELRDKSDYPIKIPDLTKAEEETAVKALIEYLTQKRSDILKLGESGDEEAVRNRLELSEIIDTTLLKCYMQTNQAMVGPLLRVSNRCNVAESEKMLKDAQRYGELVMLYCNRGYHRKALELLYKHASLPGKLQGIYETLRYLQKLGPEYIQLIFEYSKWILKEDPEEGLTIFTADDIPQVKALPQDKVVEHLKSVAPQLVVQYLEHVIQYCQATGSEFHNMLVLAYLEDVYEPMREYIRSLKGAPPPLPGEEPESLGPRRARLLHFLDESKYYEPEKMLSKFFSSSDVLLEEKAILLGRIGRHDQALVIYAHKLQRADLAEEYCRKHYNKDREYARDVYVDLLNSYLKPPEGYHPNVRAALALLKKYPDKVDMTKGLTLLPTSTKIAEIREFLSSVIQTGSQKRRQSQMMKNLHKAERLQVNEELLQYQARRTVIDDDKLCFICRKAIKTSAFACYPNGIVVHLYCNKDKALCPCSNPKCQLRHERDRSSSTAGAPAS